MKNINIRQEQQKDIEQVRDLYIKTFETDSEANLVEKIRKFPRYDDKLSLVAYDNDKIVGHIMLSKIRIEKGDDWFSVLVLAPLAVLPKYQNKGIGSKLVLAIQDVCANVGYDVIIVLGHNKFYSKFGFEKASKYNIIPPFEVPDEAFMVYCENKSTLDYVNGNVKYNECFDDLV